MALGVGAGPLRWARELFASITAVMKRFADLYTGLLFAPSRAAKLRLLQAYFSAAPDPDRGWALAALCGDLELRLGGPALLRGLVAKKVDPELFRLSHEHVGDLAETIALIWPTGPDGSAPPSFSEVVERLRDTGKAEAALALSPLLDRLGADERLVLLKLATGGFRAGVSAEMARAALSAWAKGLGVAAEVADLEELWHEQSPPFAPLFAWLSGEGERPQVDLQAAFRPMMLARPFKDDQEGEEPAVRLRPSDYAAEWKWDGLRVQAAVSGEDGVARLFSRKGDALDAAFPDLLSAMQAPGCVEGELLIVVDGEARPFAELQRRLGRKRPSRRLLQEAPAWIRAYDLLHDGEEDLRRFSFRERRTRLEAWMDRHRPKRIDLSPLIAFQDWRELAALRQTTVEDPAREGLMLKRWDGAYQAGRPEGEWWKWRHGPLTADCVLLYAEVGGASGAGEYTVGVWRDAADGAELAPVGKAGGALEEAEARKLEQWIKANVTERFGPVRAVAPELVLEVAFDGVQASARRKSGLALRAPRIVRVRWDKPAEQAEKLEALRRLIPKTGA